MYIYVSINIVLRDTAVGYDCYLLIGYIRFSPESSYVRKGVIKVTCRVKLKKGLTETTGAV